MLSITINSGLSKDRASLSMAAEAIERHNEGHDREDRITHPDAPSDILSNACEGEHLRAYVFDTMDGIEDGCIDEDAYLDWVIENVEHGWL